MSDPLATGGNESVLTLAALSTRIDDLDDRHGVTARRSVQAGKDITSLGMVIVTIATLFVLVALVLGYFIYSASDQVARLQAQQSASDARQAQTDQAIRAAQCDVIDALHRDLPTNASAAYHDLSNRLAANRAALHCTP